MFSSVYERMSGWKLKLPCFCASTMLNVIASMAASREADCSWVRMSVASRTLVRLATSCFMLLLVRLLKSVSTDLSIPNDLLLSTHSSTLRSAYARNLMTVTCISGSNAGKLKSLCA